MGHTFLIVGIPAAVICLLAGIVIFERYSERAEARKRVRPDSPF